ncbi:MAG: sugar phosphate isomerase/epimerase [Phycisphaerales bacterium]|nr:sugar phosphate isomerase/epimerase [Phycisphaerales bacterium]
MPTDAGLKLAYSANAYLRFDAHEAARRIAALGYAGIELMADAPHLWPAAATDAQIDALRRTLDHAGLAIANVNAFMMQAVGDARHPYWHPSWIEPDASLRRLRVEHTIAALRMAAKLGATSITTEPGGPLCSDGPREGRMSWAGALDVFVAGLSEALRVAEDVGVRLLVEPEPGLLIENVAQTLELCARVRSPAFGVNFDIGHMYCVGEPLAEAVGALSAHVRHYHVEDIAASRVHEHLVPGRGAIDFAPVFQAIRRTGYDGWITVELYPYIDDPDAAGAEARAHLRPLMG